jgi:hypothetical protein
MSGVSSDKSVVCRRCGSPARPGMIRCRECGELFVSVVLENGATPQPTAPAPSPADDSPGAAAAETWTGFVLETPTVPGTKPVAQPAASGGAATATDSRPYIRCQCGKKVRLRPEHAGRKVKCPECGLVHRAPKDVRPAESESVLDSAVHAPQSPSDSGSWARILPSLESSSRARRLRPPPHRPLPSSSPLRSLPFSPPQQQPRPASQRVRRFHSFKCQSL